MNPHFQKPGFRRHRQRGHHFDRQVIRVALAGNPNSGKTTIFNAMTGQRQHIGNYPGVTVDKKYGYVHFMNHIIELVDLPGTYSLSAYSMEEVVSRDFVLNEKPDVIISVMDSTNLERHLYLLLQFQELGVPIIGALNMYDEAVEKGINIDIPLLSDILGIPLIKTIGHKGRGIGRLLNMVHHVFNGDISSTKRHINYGQELEDVHNKIIDGLQTDGEFSQKYSLHWMAIKLLEKDKDAVKKIENEHQNRDAVISLTEELINFIEKHFGEDSEVVVSEQRYAYIRGALRESVKLPDQKKGRDLTEKIDRVVLNRFLGIPVFALVMFLIYQLTFTIGNPLSDIISRGIENLAAGVEHILPPGPLLELIRDGIIGGVGGVLVFLPLVVMLFLGLSFLEDTGYMARSAFVMDKFFHLFGLHGRSFIPFMVSSGCAVPGVMSARVLANPKDRIVTIMVSPIMMCGAKTPVIAMLAAAFFPENAGTVFWAVWLFGWLMAFVIALILRLTLFKGEQTPFVMELPPYRMPTLRGILQHMWEKSWEYVKKAGTVILAASIIVWFLLAYPKPKTDGQPVSPKEQIENSYGGRLGKWLEPVFKPAGFDWKINISLFAGVAAKEIIISTIGIVYGVEQDQNTEDVMVKERLANDPAYSPLAALALMIFVILYIPCMATLAVVKKELGSWKWPAFQAVYTLFVAWIFAVGIYQGGLLLGFGG